MTRYAYPISRRPRRPRLTAVNRRLFVDALFCLSGNAAAAARRAGYAGATAAYQLLKREDVRRMIGARLLRDTPGAQAVWWRLWPRHRSKAVRSVVKSVCQKQGTREPSDYRSARRKPRPDGHPSPLPRVPSPPSTGNVLESE